MENPYALSVGAIYNDAILLLKTFKDFLTHGNVRLCSLDPIIKIKDQLSDEQVQRVLQATATKFFEYANSLKYFQNNWIMTFEEEINKILKSDLTSLLIEISLQLDEDLKLQQQKAEESFKNFEKVKQDEAQKLRDTISNGFNKSLKAAKSIGKKKLFSNPFKSKKKEEEAANKAAEELLQEFNQAYNKQSQQYDDHVDRIRKIYIEEYTKLTLLERNHEMLSNILEKDGSAEDKAASLQAIIAFLNDLTIEAQHLCTKVCIELGQSSQAFTQALVSKEDLPQLNEKLKSLAQEIENFASSLNGILSQHFIDGEEGSLKIYPSFTLTGLEIKGTKAQ